jgi:2-C-methyl-D-erythritol 4-phosphate cytidylyltransferase
MAFSTDALLAAHSAGPSRDGPVWDDSVLVELNEGRVVEVEGSSKNIHVVTPDDLSIARALVAAEPLEHP